MTTKFLEFLEKRVENQKQSLSMAEQSAREFGAYECGEQYRPDIEIEKRLLAELELLVVIYESSKKEEEDPKAS